MSSHAQVLVVEDESIVAKAIQSELNGMGYYVSGVAASGEEAVQKAAETHPDVVLMDVMLRGDMDGIEAARQMRERFDIPVVFLTAFEDEATLGRARATEPFGYLLKPYEERELHTTIEMALYKHRMERRLRESHEWLSATLRSIHDAVIATDGRLYVQFLNPNAESLTGWRQALAAGEDLADVCEIRSEGSEQPLEEAVHRVLRTGAAAALPPDALLVARDGRDIPVEGTISPIPDEEGNTSGLVLVLRDISERRLIEKIRRQSEDYLRHSQKMEAVSRLAGGVAHDFNNLLTAVLGNTSLVMTALPPSDPNMELLVQVESAALRAAELVKQLLGFSGRTSLWVEPVSVNEAVEGLRKTVNEVTGSNVNVEYKLDPDLWAVHGDPAQLGEIVVNLCLNARDAMPDGGTLRIETENITTDEDYLRRCLQAQPGEFIRLRIQDTGHGIPPALQTRIFEPFFSTKEKGQGTGLGLALVFGIVQQHHGWIDLTSEIDQGTRVDVYLPRYWQRDLAPVEAAPPRTPRGVSETILLADDESLVRNLAKTILQRCGYQVLIAEDGMQAVEIYNRERHRIDLVILDLTMPRLSGEDALQRMIDIDPGVRVLFSSGYFADHVTARGEHILGFLGKPYRQNDLLGSVRDALDQVKDQRRHAGS